MRHRPGHRALAAVAVRDDGRRAPVAMATADVSILAIRGLDAIRVELLGIFGLLGLLLTRTREEPGG